jgi:cell division protein FtsW
MVLVWRGTNIATRAPDLFGMLVAMGVTTLLGIQAVINLGVVCGMLPAKGLVLPFMSYGASAATVHVICVGLLLRVGMEGESK